MISHNQISSRELHTAIRNKTILFAGNIRLKIYGRLDCASGKRMKRSNRVFFSSEEGALENRYRPCGHCMRDDYKKWKDGSVQ